MGEGGQDNGSRDVLPERRAYPRFFGLSLAGSCSVAGGTDIACFVIDMSMGGAAFRAEIDAPVGAEVIVSLPQVGLLRGRVSRVFPAGFAVAFDETRPQRERLAGFLTWFVARRLDPDLEDRGSERIVPLRRIVSIKVSGGPTVTARIIDVSRSGVAMTTTASVSPGEAVMVGGTNAHVVRLLPGGFAARFAEPLGADPDVTTVL